MALGDNRISRRIGLITGLALILSSFTTGASLAVADDLLLGAGGKSSFSHFAAKAVCRTISRFDRNTTCRVIPSGNPTDNLTNLLSGSLDLALVDSRTIYEAFHRAGSFQFVALEYDQLRLLMPLYRTPISLLARQNAKIGAIADLAGKKVNAGAPYSFEEKVFRELMAAHNWNEQSFRLYQTLPPANAQDYLALHGGSVEAMLHIGMHPDRKVGQSLKSGTVLVGITGPAVEKLIASNVGFSSGLIPARLYPKKTEPIETLALETLLVASSDLGNATVELVLQAIMQGRRQLQYSHPALVATIPGIKALNESYLHPHPEAVLFFQSNR